MKVLIAISSKQYSGSTLDVGMKISRVLRSSTTIVDVGDKISEFNSKDINLINEIMDSWNIDRPGVDVLEWAYNYLVQNKFIGPQSAVEGFPKHMFLGNDRRAEVLLEGSAKKNLNLILRNGDIIEELRNEVNSYDYDLTIIGGSGRKGMAHDLVQYIDSSIFLVNDFSMNKDYNILLAVNNSISTPKAIKYGVRVSQALSKKVNLLYVSEEKDEKGNDTKAVHRAEKMLRRCGVNFTTHIKEGDPVDTIVESAGHDHIIIMGASTQSPLKKFFIGSKPLSVIGRSHCPTLVVK